VQILKIFENGTTECVMTGEALSDSLIPRELLLTAILCVLAQFKILTQPASSLPSKFSFSAQMTMDDPFQKRASGLAATLP